MKKLNEILEQLRNLDPNDPGRWPLAARIGTVVLLFVLAASAGYWYFVWKAKRPELLEARAKETELWNTLEAKARKAANLQAYKDQLAEMARQHRPKMIIAGGSAYPRIIDFRRFREIADAAGALLLGACNYGLSGGGGFVPEPSTWTMLILGFGLVGLAARRFRVLANA